MGALSGVFVLILIVGFIGSLVSTAYHIVALNIAWSRAGRSAFDNPWLARDVPPQVRAIKRRLLISGGIGALIAWYLCG